MTAPAQAGPCWYLQIFGADPAPLYEQDIAWAVAPTDMTPARYAEERLLLLRAGLDITADDLPADLRTGPLTVRVWVPATHTAPPGAAAQLTLGATAHQAAPRAPITGWPAWPV